MAEAADRTPPNRAKPVVRRRVEAELTRLLYRLGGFGLFSNFVLALVLAAGLFSHFPHEWTLLWLGALLVVSVGRWLLNRAFALRPRTDAETEPWRMAFLAGLVLAGSLWGAAGWVFLDTPALLPRLLILLILAGMNAGAARSLASSPAAFWLYLLTTLIPCAVRFFTFSDDDAHIVALCVFTYALFLLHTARMQHEDLSRLYQLIFENEELVLTLNQAKERAEAAAATAVHEIAVGNASPRFLPPPQPEVHVDHPFLFAIQEWNSSVCLFLGRVTYPRSGMRVVGLDLASSLSGKGLT